TARYYLLGPGRDRNKAIAAYDGLLRQGESIPSGMINLGEALRKKREYARAEVLNLAAARRAPESATPLGNAFELQLDQGKLKEAAITLAQLRKISARYGATHDVTLSYAEGDLNAVRAKTDSLLRAGDDNQGPGISQLSGVYAASSLALLEGRWRDYVGFTKQLGARSQLSYPYAGIEHVALEAVLKGPSAADVVRMDAAGATIARGGFGAA